MNVIKYEDTIQGYFYSTKSLSNKDWDFLCNSVNETIASISNEYMWYRDEFKVMLPIFNDGKSDGPCHLISATCFGDCLEDEWFIVYIIFELTKKYDHLIVQLEDNDGDFLLIEAAECLPMWLNPDTTINRVFIYKQQLHLIPPSMVCINQTLKLCDALKLIEQNCHKTVAPIEVQHAILKRIGKYPEKIEENYHKAIIRLPLEIATVLTLKPEIISTLVSTYCNLDALEVKHCKDIPFDNLINVQLKFTKHIYAMLVHSKLVSNVKINKKIEMDKKSHLGLKIACGYKLITDRMSKDIFSTPQYDKFLNSLNKNGYFKNNLEGSKQYNKLLDKAKEYFLDIECPISCHVANLINELKQSKQYCEISELIKKNNDLNCLEEDNDDWLNVNPDELEEFLENNYGKKMNIKKDDPITPQTITSKLSKFLNETSDFEGIEHTRNENATDNIEFNSDEFVNCLEKMLSIVSNQGISEDEMQFSDSDNDGDDDIMHAQDSELASKLKAMDGQSTDDSTIVFQNFIQSMKDEGLTGPSSTVMRTIGVKKKNMLDSDDDDDYDDE